MSILAQAWREARPLHRVTFAAGALLLSALFVAGLVYPVLAWGRPPGLSQDPLLRARLLLDEGRLDASVREYASSALVNRGDAHGLSEWGRALGKSGDVNGELDAQSRALRLRPGDAQLQSEVAGALFRAGRYPEAIAAWGRVLQRNPRDFRAWTGLGEAWLELDRYTEAAAAFTKALEIQPRNAAAHNSLGIVRSLQGRTEDAVRHFRAAVEILPIPEFVANLKRAEAP
jgi:tetratricopeptide (TPR) repeat protein